MTSLLSSILVAVSLFAAVAARRAHVALRSAREESDVERAIADASAGTYSRVVDTLTEQTEDLREALHEALDDSIESRIRTMCKAFGQPVNTRPALVDEDTARLRTSLMLEEVTELVTATDDRDLVEIADALGDIVVIAYGTAAAYGIPLDDVLHEIHRTNMAKVDPATGQVNRRDDGKVLKPAGWQPPRIAELLGVEEAAA